MEKCWEFHIEISSAALISAGQKQDGSLRLIVPGDHRGMKGQCLILDVKKGEDTQPRSLQVTDGLTNYIMCSMSKCCQFAAFAQSDQRKFKIFELDGGQELNTKTRSNDAALPRCLSLQI